MGVLVRPHTYGTLAIFLFTPTYYLSNCLQDDHAPILSLTREITGNFFSFVLLSFLERILENESLIALCEKPTPILPPLEFNKSHGGGAGGRSKRTSKHGMSQ